MNPTLEVRAIVRSHLGISPCDLDMSAELGNELLADADELTSIGEAIDDKFGVEIAGDITAKTTTEDLIRSVRKQMSAVA